MVHGAGRLALLGAVVLLAVSGTDEAADAVGVPRLTTERIVVDRPLEPSVVSIRGALLTVAARDDGRAPPPPLLRSVDAGRTWEQVHLPGAPPRLVMGVGLLAGDSGGAGELAVVRGCGQVGGGALPPANVGSYLWTSTDGVTWRGGLIGPEVGLVRNHAVEEVGDLLVTLATFETGPVLFSSADRGATWRARDLAHLSRPGDDITLLPPLWSADPRPAIRLVMSGPSRTHVGGATELLTSFDGGDTWRTDVCGQDPPLCGLGLQVGDLVLRGWETSTDGGQTWKGIELDDDVEEWFGEAAEMTSIVWAEPLPEGGWLALVEGGEDTSIHVLVRSSDGVHWHRVLPRDDCFLPYPRARMSEPVLHERSWYVAVTCEHDDGSWSGVVEVAAEGAERFAPVSSAAIEDPLRLAEPVTVDGAVLVPVTSASPRGEPRLHSLLEMRRR